MHLQTRPRKTKIRLRWLSPSSNNQDNITNIRHVISTAKVAEVMVRAAAKVADRNLSGNGTSTINATSASAAVMAAAKAVVRPGSRVVVNKAVVDLRRNIPNNLLHPI